MSVDPVAAVLEESLVKTLAITVLPCMSFWVTNCRSCVDLVFYGSDEQYRGIPFFDQGRFVYAAIKGSGISPGLRLSKGW